jgi:hypothetical protein
MKMDLFVSFYKIKLDIGERTGDIANNGGKFTQKVLTLSPLTEILRTTARLVRHTSKGIDAMQATNEIPEPTINDLHSAHLEPLLVLIENELDAIDRKHASAIDRDLGEIRSYMAGQKVALQKLRRNLSATQASAIERETGA